MSIRYIDIYIAYFKKNLVLAVFYKIKQTRQGAKNRVKVTCLRNYFEVRRSDELNKRSSRQVKIYRKIKFIYKYFDSFCQKFCYFNIEYRIEISIYRIDIVSNQKSFYRNYRNIDISISLCPSGGIVQECQPYSAILGK